MKTKKKQIEYDIILIFRRKTKTIENMKNSFILIYLCLVFLWRRIHCRFIYFFVLNQIVIT